MHLFGALLTLYYYVAHIFGLMALNFAYFGALLIRS
jgi:hypothetical protein